MGGSPSVARDADRRRLRFTLRDGLAYALAFLAWVALSGASAVALLGVRSLVGPLTLAILAANPAAPRRTWEIFAQAGGFDRIALVTVGLLWLVYFLRTEEYLRSSIGDARAQRARALSAGAEDDPALTMRGLRTLGRRTAVAAAFPAAASVLYLLLQGVLWLLLAA
jgi:hypothetical protein